LKYWKSCFYFHRIIFKGHKDRFDNCIGEFCIRESDECKIRTLPDKTFKLGFNGTDKQYLKKTVKEKDLAS
jgi:hypothetical protein